MAGITPNGFEARTFEDVLSDLETQEKARIDPTLDTKPEGILGNLNGIWSREVALIWENERVLYSMFDPDNAEGALLDNVCKLSGISRRPGTYSFTSVDGYFTSSGVTLLPNVHFFSTNSGLRYTPSVTFTSPSAGTHTFNIRAEDLGPQTVDAGAISTIGTPVPGLDYIDNSLVINSLNSGDAPETDAVLRARRKSNLSRRGACTVPALESALNELDTDNGEIYYAKVYEALDEPTDFVETRNSFKAIIYDTNSGDDWDDEIAQVIFNNKPAGIVSLGSEDGYATYLGVEYPVRFERAEVVDLYIEATYYYSGVMPNSTSVKEYIKSVIDSSYSVGDDVVSFAAASIPLNAFSNIRDVDFTGYNIGTSPSPTSNSNVTMNFNQKPTVQVANITLAFAPFVDN